MTTDLGLCEDCFSTIPFRFKRYPRDGALSESYAWGAYYGPLGASIRRAKFRPDLRIMKAIAAKIIPTIPNIDFDVVVPVASSPMRIYRRGFSPALVLSQSISRHFNKPCRDVFIRRDSSQQSMKSRIQRQRASELFGLKRILPPSRVLLVDDVRATGSTLRSCSTLLLSAGARKVIGLVVTSV